MPSARVWDKHEIKAEIGRRGYTLKALAEKYGIGPGSIRQTLMRKAPITRADQIISDFLQVPLHELWPGRYDASGHRLVQLKPIGSRPKRRKRASSSKAAAE